MRVRENQRTRRRRLQAAVWCGAALLLAACVVFSTGAIVVDAHAADGAPEKGAGTAGAAGAETAGAPMLKCTFDAGLVKTFEKGAFSTVPAEALSFTIGNVDLEGQTAKLITPTGEGNLRVVRAINANHFLEVVNEGFLNVTTVFEEPVVAGQFPAVHSRHLGVLGQPVVSQYTGVCQRVNK